MASSAVEVYNQALSLIGTRSSVSATTEQSREAEVCTQWYATVRDSVLRAAFWPCAKGWKRLALLVERDFSLDWTVDDPGPQWQFAYSVPSDMLTPRFMSTYGRFTMEMYRPSTDDAVLAIMTDEPDALLQYTFKQTNVAFWDPDLSMAVSHGLAAMICIGLTGKLDLAQLRLQEANNKIMLARERSANEHVEAYDTIAEWHARRGYAEPSPPTKYLYPYGPALSISGELGPVTRIANVI